MIRWRRLAKSLITLALLTVALSASAASVFVSMGVVPVMGGELIKILAWVVGIVMGFLAIVGLTVRLLVTPVTEKQMAVGMSVLQKQADDNKEWLREAIAEIAAGFNAIMDRHVDSHDPHPRASDRMHQPLYEADKEILGKLEELKALREHDAKRLTGIVRAHNAAMLHQQSAFDAIGCLAHRDPKASPYTRRSTDPPDFDATVGGLRGHARSDNTLIPDEEDP